MMLVVISPERDRADEIPTLVRLFEAGLDRYHVRKPHASLADLARWLDAVPAVYRPRLILHQHHELVERFGLGGRHWPDRGDVALDTSRRGGWRSGSCHDLDTLSGAFGCFDSVFLSPVFPSVSKPGYGPKDQTLISAVAARISTRSEAERKTAVLALGGITLETAPRALALGFDGFAALGAVWHSVTPVAAFQKLLAVSASCPTHTVIGRNRTSIPTWATHVC